MHGLKWETIPIGTADIHVVPRDDLREHETNRQCWCHPNEAPDCQDVVIHHSMDRREDYEEGQGLQ